MSGRSSRRKGNKYEVTCASELSDRLGLDIRTGRWFGLTYGADLVTVTGYDNLGRPVTYEPSVLGWSIECKARKVRQPKAWLTQATDQAAPGTTPVVLWRRTNFRFEQGSAFLWDHTAARGWTEMPIGEWLDAVALGALDGARYDEDGAA